MRLTRALAWLTVCGLGFTAVLAVRPSTTGETRPSPGHGHTLETSSSTASMPSMLDFVPTYAEHVKPILETNCVSCHTAGGIAPFTLDEYESARDTAKSVAAATRAKRMPPFPPAGESPKFNHELRLSDDEIAVLSNWYWAGAPSGDLKNAKTGEPRAFPTVRADVKLDIGRNFQPSAELSDEYRCFILDPKLDADRFIAGYDIVPGNRKVVHHVLMYELPDNVLTEARALERAETDGRGGYTCFGGPRVGSGLQPIGAWAPGGAGVKFPAGTGAKIRSSSKLVVQVHYNLANGAEPDRTGVNLELAPKDAKLRALQNFSPVAPVEIACAGVTPTDATHPCSRQSAYARVLQLNNSRGNQRRMAGRDLEMCSQALDSYRDPVDASRITTSCEYFTPARLTIYGLTGHMHYLGKSVKIEKLSPNGSRRVLLDIPRWDFHWQGFYWLQQPVTLERGDKVRISCVFDNSQANQPFLNGKQREPRYVVWGEGTDEEMCLSYVQATVDGI
jgi:hypothetical protein